MSSPDTPIVEPTSCFTLGDDDPGDRDQALSPRILALWRTGYAVAGLVLVGLALIVGTTATALPDPVRFAIPALVAIAAVLLVAWLPSALYQRWSYRLSDQSLELRHGLVVQQQSSVPYFRVQHVDVRRGLLQGWFGIVSLTVSTASPATDAELPGLEPERAEAIRRRILDRTEADDGV